MELCLGGQAFEFAKYLKGYLATITSEAEWQVIKENLLSLGENADNNIWIGYNTIQTPGNPREYTWITGEKSKVNWSNTTSTENYFNSGERNNQGGNEGCVHIINASDNADRRWNDIDCDFSNSGWSSPWQDLIIEFEQ